MFTNIFLFAYSAFNAHALGALADVAGPGLDFHLGTVLLALLAAMGDDDEVCGCNSLSLSLSSLLCIYIFKNIPGSFSLEVESLTKESLSVITCLVI